MNYIKPKYLDIPFYMRANILHKECNKSAPKKSNLGRRVRDPFRTTSLKTEFFFLSTSSWVEVLKKKPNNIKVCDIATFPTCGNDPEPEVVEGDVHPVHPKIRRLVELSG